ncbi:Aminopeptidase N, partial [Harpegnathos saltator]
TGYYRVNYNNKTWWRIATVLNYEDIHQINDFKRAQLIDDAYYLMIQEYISPLIFWNIAEHLAREVSYIIWYLMFNILSYM